MAQLMNGRQLSCIGEDSSPSSPEKTVNNHVAGIRRSALLSYTTLSDFNAQSSVENDTLTVEPTADQDSRPVINDVRLVDKDQLARSLPVSRYATTRRQRTLRTRLEQRRSSDDSCLPVMQSTRPSSTFTNLPLQSVYIELGDYQTLLRPMKHLVEESEETADDDPNACAVGDGVDDAPPTPTSYGDDTLRAMAVITQKYDSFRRRQMRVRSFLVSRLSRSTSRDSTCALDDSIADTLRRDASNTLNRSAAAAAAAMSFRRRLADDHAMAMSPPDDVTPEVLQGGHVTPAEVERARLFYSSLGSRVVVCGSLADVSVGCLAVGRARQGKSGRVAAVDSVAGCCWVHLLTGVPVLVLSVGSPRSRRELTVVIADRSSALPLWQDRINSMSSFRQLPLPVCPGDLADAAGGGGGASLTMRVSGGLTKRVRFDVFSRRAACELMTAYTALTADPNDELWNISDDTTSLHMLGAAGDAGRQPRRRQREHKTGDQAKSVPRLSRVKALTSADISRPCQPRWITRVDAADSNFRSAFADYLPIPAVSSVPGAGTPAADDEFRPRLPTN